MLCRIPKCLVGLLYFFKPELCVTELVSGRQYISKTRGGKPYYV